MRESVHIAGPTIRLHLQNVSIFPTRNSAPMNCSLSHPLPSPPMIPGPHLPACCPHDFGSSRDLACRGIIFALSRAGFCWSLWPQGSCCAAAVRISFILRPDHCLEWMNHHSPWTAYQSSIHGHEGPLHGNCESCCYEHRVCKNLFEFLLSILSEYIPRSRVARFLCQFYV